MAGYDDCIEIAFTMPQASFSDLINGERTDFVDFSAEWCGPCKMMAPILAELKSEVGDMVLIIKIDVRQEPADCFGISNSKRSDPNSF
jgi:thiol-disulfide isomerase/thioredoxin